MTFYNDETVLGTDIDISDGLGRVGDAGSNNITVAVNTLDHYSNDAASGGSIAGDGTATFVATINARDQYGNLVAGDSSITLTAVPQDGHTVGTLGGTKVLNMTSGTTTVSDLTYNAAGSLKLGSTGGTASIDNATAGRSTVYSFDSDIGAVHNYLVEIPDGTNVIAGDNTYRIRITARDSSNNTISDASVDAALSARTFTISGFGESPEGTAFTPAAGFTWSAEVSTGQEANFSNGIATIEITPVKAETISSFTVTDGSGISGTYNSGDITISPAAFNKIVIDGASTGVADGNSGSPTNYVATVTGRDTYGNLTIASEGIGYNALVLTTTRISGAANTGTVTSTPATIDLTTNSSTTVNINYNIAHTTRFNFSNGSATSVIDTNLTPIVTWAIDPSTASSYTLTANNVSTTASTQISYKLTAFDAGGNQIIGEDSTLNGISFDFSATGNDCDAPNKAITSIEATINGTAFASATSITANGINSGFSNGIWNIPVTFYNTNSNCGAVGYLNITDSDNTINVTSTNSVTVGPSTGYYVSTTATGLPQDADNNRKDSTSITATLYDQYGNEKSNSTINGTFLNLSKISGYGSSNGTVYACGPTGNGVAANYGDGCSNPIDLSTISIDFNGTSTQTIYDLSYDVGNVIEIRFDNGSGVTTQSSPAAVAQDISWNTVTGTVGSYTFVNPAGPITSGVSANWTITALDRAANTIIGIDTDLDGMSLSITDETAGSFDAPDSSNNWSNSIGNFSSGVAIASMTIYSDQDVANSDFTLVDATNSINTSNSGGAVIVNPETNCNRFTVSTNNLSSSPAADGNSIANTDATISCVDTYGNLTSYSGGNTIRLDIVHVTDAQAYGANEGTLLACTDAAGNACGSPTDITTHTLNFSSPTQQRTVHDLSYNVGHDLYIRAYEDGGTIDTAESNSTRIEWQAVGTIDSYTITPIAGSANAGSVTSWEIRAYDVANNQMTNENGLNDTILSARNYTISETAAGSGNMDGPTATSVSLPAGASTTFTNGVGTLTGADGLTFYNSDNDVQTNYLQVQDELSNTGTQTAGMSIDPEGVGAKFEVTATGTFPANATNDETADTDTEITITLFDQYGNQTTDSTVTNATITPSIQTSDATYTSTGSLKLCGPATPDANNGDGCSTPLAFNSLTYDFTSSTTQVLYDLSYDVAHDVELIIDSTARGGITTTSGDSADLTWNATSKIVNSYTLTFNDTTAIAGTTTNLSLTAYDSADNLISTEDTILDALTFDFSNTGTTCDAPNSASTSIVGNMNGTAFSSATSVNASAVNGGFTSGVWSIPVTLYNTNVGCGAINFIDINETGNSLNVKNTDSISINTAAGYYVSTTATGLPQDADNNRKDSTSITATLYDQYGNQKSNSTINGTFLNLSKISGYGSSNGTVYACGPTGNGVAANYGDGCSNPIDLSTISIDFNGTSTQTIYDLSYDVGNVIEIRFDNGSGVTTQSSPAAVAQDISWNTVTGTVGSYTFVNPAGPITSGVSANWTITALDRAAANTIIGIDTDLDGMSLSITDETAGSFDAPDSSNNWSNSIGNFSSGVAIASMTIYSDQDVANSDFTLVDATNSINTSNSGGAVIVNPETNCNRFTVSTNNLSSSPAADGNSIANTDATISCVDTYGNLTSYSGGNTIRLDIVHVTDAQAYGANEGTLLACTDAAGNACGSPTDITTHTLNFSSPTQQRTVHDLSYNVGHDLYIRAYEDGGTIDTAESNSTRIEWQAVAGTIDSYTITPIAGSANAGSVTSWEIRAYDVANNQMTNENGLNDTILSARNYTISETAAGSGNMDGPTATSVSLPAGASTTFTNGVGTLTGADGLTFYNSDNDVQTNYLQVQDELSNTGTQTAGMSIDPEGVGAKFEVTATGTFPANATNDETADTDTEITITLFDQYGNQTTDSTVTNATITPSIQTSDATYTSTGSLKLCGPATPDANNGDGCSTPLAFNSLTYDFTSSTTQVLYDLSYDVAHDVELIIDSTARGGITTTSGDSADLTWNATSKIVNSYTLTFNDTTAIAGTTTNLSLTAYDSAGNLISTEDTILDALTFDFSNTGTTCDAPNSASTSIVGNMNGTAFSSATSVNASAVNGGFTSGVWSIPVTLYNTNVGCGAINFIDINETGNSLNVKNTDSISINTAAGYYVSTTATGLPQDADNNRKDSTSITATLYDQYGNQKSNSTINGTFLNLSKISGYGSSNGTVYACGPTGNGVAANYGDGCSNPIDLSTISIDFNGTSTQTIYDLSYDVGNVIEIRFDNGSGVTTQSSPAAVAQDISWNTVTGTVGSYTFVNPAGPITSGVSANWTITALDRAANTIIGIDTDLDGMSLSITDETAGSFDAPDSSNNWSNSIGNFSSGVAIASMTIYSDQDVANSDFTLVDATNSINTSNSGGAVIVNPETNCNRFTVSTNNLSSSPAADGNSIANTDATISCVDTYGNLTSYSGGNTIRLDIVHVTDAQAYGANEGTLLACTDAAGNACGSPTDITTHTLNFSSPTQQRTVHDLSYNVGHDLYIRAYEDGGTIDTAESNSTRIEWQAVAGTIDSYTITPVAGSANAGSVTSWEIRAYDVANNQMTNENGLNDTILSARNYTISETAAGSGNMDGPTATSVSLPAGASTTFTNGVGTLTGADGTTFYNSDNDVQTNYLQVQDELSNTGTQTAGMSIDPEGVGAKFEVTATGTFPANATNDETADTDTEITITLFDQYGNQTTDSTITNATITPSLSTSDINYSITGTIKACGPATPDTNNGDGCSTPLAFNSLTYDFTSSTTQVLYDLSYDVAHDVELIIDSTARGGITTTSGDSADLTWNATSKIVNSYTLTFDDTTAIAGTTTNLSLTAYDSAGNKLDQPATDSTLEALSFSFTATTDNDAPTSGDSVQNNDPANGSSFTFNAGVATIPYIFFKDRNIIGSANEITITDENSVSATPDNADSIDINPNTAVDLVFTSSAHTTTAGVCSAAVTIETRDTYGNPSNVSGDQNITLAENSDMTFYSDSGCSSSIGTTATILNGTSSITFYYQDTNDGTTTLSLTSGFNDPAAQSHTINPNTAVDLVFTSSAHTTTAGVCSAAVTIETRDTYGNISNVASDLTVNLTENSDMVFYSNSDCSSATITSLVISSGTSGATFYYIDTNDGTTNLTLTSTYNDPAAQSHTINPNTAVDLVFTSSAHTTTAGVCSAAVTIETRDTYGNISNVASDLTVNLTENSDMVFYSNSDCSSGAITSVTITSGTSGATFYYIDTNDGTTDLTLTSTYNDPAAQSHTINPNTAVDLVFTSSPILQLLAFAQLR